MDGVPQEYNDSDDPQDEWSVYSDVATAADDLVHGTHNSALQFVPADGVALRIDVPDLTKYML